MKSEFHVFPPSLPLARWVQFIWISKGENDTTKSKVLPNGAIELILNFGNKQNILEPETGSIKKTYTDFWIAGFQHKPIIIQSVSDTNLLGIRFLPGGAYPFFKVPVSDFSNNVFEIEWLRNELDPLRNAIAEASDHNQILWLTESYLENKLNDNFLPNAAVTYVIDKINSMHEIVPIKELINKTGYSHKHFLTLFQHQVGTTPKNLQRIVRFQKIIRSVKNNNRVRWTDVLYHFSYYDPSHFLHDFKELADMTPQQYFLTKTFDENHCRIR